MGALPAPKSVQDYTVPAPMRTTNVADPSSSMRHISDVNTHKTIKGIGAQGGGDLGQRRAESGVGFMMRGSHPPPTSYGFWGSAESSSSPAIATEVRRQLALAADVGVVTTWIKDESGPYRMEKEKHECDTASQEVLEQQVTAIQQAYQFEACRTVWQKVPVIYLHN